LVVVSPKFFSNDSNFQLDIEGFNLSKVQNDDKPFSVSDVQNDIKGFNVSNVPDDVKGVHVANVQLDVKEGEEVEMNCSLIANPEASEIEWRKNVCKS
jgi:hypothetical protein